MPEQQLRFEQWANFYVITSAAALTLLGLLFVVITLAVGRGRKDTPSIRIYLRPAVIYFSSVLLLSALLIIPNQTRLTAVLCICLEGIAGLGYSGFLAIRRGASYQSRSDLFPYAVLPLAAYALMVAGGLLLLSRPQRGLDLVAVGHPRPARHRNPKFVVDSHHDRVVVGLRSRLGAEAHSATPEVHR